MSEALYDLSIVIVSWNSFADLKISLPALNRSKDLKLQVIVVDNNSDEETQQWLKEYSGIEAVFLTENLGFSAGCNAGLQKAQSPYIVFLNPDTEVLPDSLSILLQWMKAHPQAGACGPRLTDSQGNLQYSTRSFPTLWSEFCQEFRLSALFPYSHFFAAYYLAHWPHDRERQVDVVTGAVFLVRRECLDEIGSFDDKMSFMYYEELDLCWRLNQAGYATYFVPQASVKHIGGTSTKNISSRARFYLLQSRFNFHLKHGGRSRVVILWMIHLISASIMILGLGLLYLLGFKKSQTKNLLRVYQVNFRYLFCR